MKTYPLAYQNQQHQLKLQPKLKQQCKKGLLQRYEHQQHKEKQQNQHKVWKEETDVALVVGRAAWWIPVLPTTNNNMRNLTFGEALKDFLQNVSFHCYGKLVETGRQYQERLFWLIFHMAALCLLIIFLKSVRNTGGQLLTTNTQDSLYPLDKVRLPSVSICSINRISNVSATRYAEELNRKDPYNHGVAYFYQQIKMLKYNYFISGTMNNFDKALEFQKFLDTHDRKETELFYNTRRRMASLTPRCADMLVQCRFDNKVVNCSQVFKETFTSRGLCCTFNNEDKYSVDSLSKKFSSFNFGLVVMLGLPKNDNFYKMFKLSGFLVDIYSPKFYPVHLSGGVERHFALTGTSTSLALTAHVHKTDKATSFLSPKVRNCLFADEVPELYGNNYSFNNCVTLCRIRSIIVLCGCIPFHVPYENFTVPIDAIFCSLLHKECLMHYQFKWFNVITRIPKDISGLEREIQTSLYCSHCLPSCSETQYKVRETAVPLNKYTMKSFPVYEENSSDLALVRIYFAKGNAILFRKVLANSWLEILGSVGSICGLIVGMSLITICEIIFFVVEQIVVVLKNERHWARNRRTTADQTLIILP